MLYAAQIAAVSEPDKFAKSAASHFNDIVQQLHCRVGGAESAAYTNRTCNIPIERDRCPTPLFGLAVMRQSSSSSSSMRTMVRLPTVSVRLSIGLR
jgi:hypothetical protein